MVAANRKFDPGAMSHLAAEVTQEDVDRAMSELRGMLSATRTTRGRLAPGSRPVKIEVPDFKARAFAIEMICRLKNFPTPTLKEVRVLHKGLHRGETAPASGAAALRELQAQGMDVRDVLESYLGQLEQAAPDPPQLPESPPGAVELPE